MKPPDPAYRTRVLAFRASGHHLDTRMPHAQLMDALAGVGLRDVRASGLASLHARIDDVEECDLRAGRESGSILEVISARGTDTLVPAADVAVFTIGTLPADEDSLRARLKPWLDVLSRSGRTATDAVQAASDAARHALADGPLLVGELSGALTARLPDLSAMCHGRCGSVHIVQGLFDLAGESGLWHQVGVGKERHCVAMPEPVDRASARQELVRRYLGCYGPSTPTHFAEWCGIGVADAARSLAEAHTVELSRRNYLLADDVARFESPPRSAGVSLLPPRDPYLLDRDRQTLIPDRNHQKELWRARPTDGLVLVDGIPAATWGSKITGNCLSLSVRPFEHLSKETLRTLGAEAGPIASHRGCAAAEVALA